MEFMFEEDGWIGREKCVCYRLNEKRFKEVILADARLKN